jgi:hypothetical protein
MRIFYGYFTRSLDMVELTVKCAKRSKSIRTILLVGGINSVVASVVQMDYKHVMAYIEINWQLKILYRILRFMWVVLSNFVLSAC